MDFLKGWRTVIVNVIAAVLPLLDQFGLIGLIPADFMIWYVLVLIAMNLTLRLVTDTPVGKSNG